jgi:hypothetical protein
MLKKLIFVCLLLSPVAVVHPAGASTQPKTSSAATNGLVAEFLSELTVRVSRDRVAPTKASRLYANVAYAMFLASAPSDDLLFKKLGNVPELPVISFWLQRRVQLSVNFAIAFCVRRPQVCLQLMNMNRCAMASVSPMLWLLELKLTVLKNQKQ